MNLGEKSTKPDKTSLAGLLMFRIHTRINTTFWLNRDGDLTFLNTFLPHEYPAEKRDLDTDFILVRLLGPGAVFTVRRLKQLGYSIPAKTKGKIIN